MALKRRRLARDVTGFVRRAESIKECLDARAVDGATLSLQEAVAGSDLIVLCTPISRMRPLLQLMLPHLKQGAIVTDVGSVKGQVVRDLEGFCSKAGAHFVGSHPMAGSERTGVSAARADLFEDAICVVTPTRRSRKDVVTKVQQLWKSVGGKVIRLDAELHDKAVSRSSHLPHLVAAALANLVLDPAAPKSQAVLCANGFRDTTRIAAGSPEMWRDIAMANRRHVSRALSEFVRELTRLNQAITRGELESIEKFLSSAQARRLKWRPAGVPAAGE